MLKNIVSKLFLFKRKMVYSFFSNNKKITGSFVSNQPVVIKGLGDVVFGSNVNFGVVDSPFFLNSYAYLEARTKHSVLSFGNNIHINNGFSVISEKKIVINDNVLIGVNCQIMDSVFHNLDAEKRLETDPKPEEVVIGENVFIGNNVTILKGVNIGENSVVANGAIVTKSFPKNVVIAGVPAKIIRDL